MRVWRPWATCSSNVVRSPPGGGEEGSGVKIDFYLAPKVGLVKIEIIAKDGGANRFELTEFKEAKK